MLRLFMLRLFILVLFASLMVGCKSTDDAVRGGLAGCAVGNIFNKCYEAAAAGAAVGKIYGETKTEDQPVLHQELGYGFAAVVDGVEPENSTKGKIDRLAEFLIKDGRTIVVTGFHHSSQPKYFSLARAEKMANFIRMKTLNKVRVLAQDGGVLYTSKGKSRIMKVRLQ